MYTTFLNSHLLGAAALLVFAAAAVFTFLQPPSRRDRFFAHSIAALGGWQLVTGSLLALAHPAAITPRRLCVNILAYLGGLLVLELLLYRRLRRVPSVPFPLYAVNVSLGLGAATALAAVAMLFSL